MRWGEVSESPPISCAGRWTEEHVVLRLNMAHECKEFSWCCPKHGAFELGQAFLQPATEEVSVHSLRAMAPTPPCSPRAPAWAAWPAWPPSSRRHGSRGPRWCWTSVRIESRMGSRGGPHVCVLMPGTQRRGHCHAMPCLAVVIACCTTRYYVTWLSGIIPLRCVAVSVTLLLLPLLLLLPVQATRPRAPCGTACTPTTPCRR